MNKQIEEMASIIFSKINGANFDDVNDAVIALYNAGYRKQSEWISIKDRLPDGQGHFLTVDDTGYMMVAMWTKQFGWFSHICKANKITHWMPLPEPPKMKGGE